MPIALARRFRDAQSRPGAALFEVLADRVNSSSQNKRVVSQEDVFLAFAATGFDYVGQISNGYSDYGLKVSANVSADLAALFAPGFVKLEVGGGLSGEATRNLLLVLARQPKLLEPTKEDQVTLKTDKACCFMALRGAAFTATVSASATAGVQVGFTSNAEKPFDHNIKERSQMDAEARAAKARAQGRTTGETISDTALESIGIGASASASATLSGSYSGTYLFLRERHPTFYASFMDPELRKHFFEFVGVGQKALVKARIQQLFKDIAAFWPDAPKLAWYEHVTKAITGGNIDFARLEAGLNKAKAVLQRAALLSQPRARMLLMRVRAQQAQADELLKKGFFARRNDRDKAAFKSKLKELFQEDALSIYLPEGAASADSVKTASWKKALDQAESLLKICSSTGRREELEAEVDHHLKTICAFREYDRSRTAADLIGTGDAEVLYSGLCFLSLWGHSPSVGAEAKATVSAKALVALSAEASAVAGAQKSWKWTHYRFQHYVPSQEGQTDRALPCVVSTQDTSIAYSQTVLHVGASASATGLGEKRAEEKRAYNAMSYDSANVYWSHPVLPRTTVTPVEVTTMPGSGYAFGQSVTLKTLAAHASGSDDESREFLRLLAARLDVTPEQLEEFLAQSWVLGAARDLRTEAVLLESTFSAAPGLKLDVVVDGKAGSRPKLQDGLRDKIIKESRKPDRSNLESLRFRYRIADQFDAATTNDELRRAPTPFRLGIPAGPVKVGIALEVVTRAGAYGIVDLDCYWFNARASMNTDLKSLTVRDDTVPPVALFHQ